MRRWLSLRTSWMTRTTTRMRHARAGPRRPPSPRMPPFVPARQLAGRSKSRRWEDDPSVGSSDDELASSTTHSSYLDATRKALRATFPPPTGASDAAHCAVEGTHPVPARGKQRHRRRTAVPNGHGTQPLNAARVPAQRRLGSQPMARVPVHQRLGQRRQAPVPDTRQPHHGPKVDADGFHIVESRRHRRSPRSTETKCHRPIPPEPVGLCFNCLTHNHIVAQCRSLSHCLRYQGIGHRARACKRACLPACKPSSSVVRRPSQSAFKCRPTDPR